MYTMSEKSQKNNFTVIGGEFLKKISYFSILGLFIKQLLCSPYSYEYHWQKQQALPERGDAENEED